MGGWECGGPVSLRGAACSAKLEGGEAEPSQHTQVAQVAVAQPIGKG